MHGASWGVAHQCGVAYPWGYLFDGWRGGGKQRSRCLRNHWSSNTTSRLFQRQRNMYVVSFLKAGWFIYPRFPFRQQPTLNNGFRQSWPLPNSQMFPSSNALTCEHHVVGLGRRKSWDPDSVSEGDFSVMVVEGKNHGQTRKGVLLLIISDALSL